jgi:hypothetical protein
VARVHRRRPLQQLVLAAAPHARDRARRPAGRQLEGVVERRRKLRFDDDGENATILRVEHRGFDDDGRRAEHEQGWNDCLDRLPSACGR